MPGPIRRLRLTWKRRRALPVTAALALLTPLIPAAALVAAVPGTALAASPGQQEVYVLTNPEVSGVSGTLYGLSAANPATQEFQVADSFIGGAGTTVVVSPDSSAVYPGGDTVPVAPVNTLTGTLGTPIGPTPIGFGSMAMSPDGTTLYFPTGTGISEYHPATGKLTQNAIPVLGIIWGFAVSPDGSTLYAALNGSNVVDVINIATKSVTSTIPVPSTPDSMVLSPDGTRLYVSENKADTITVINTATGTVAANISMPSLPDAPMNVTDSTCISPDGSTLYVPGAPGEPVQVVSTATGTITATISNTTNENETSCAVSPDGSQVWVGYANPLNQPSVPTVIAYSTSTHAVIGKGAVGAEGESVSIAFGPDQAPNAALSVTPGPQYQSTQFGASASTSAYSTITNYAWNFGDGTTASTATPTTSHVYTSPGPFTATVTETDSVGTSTTATTLGNGIENIRSGGPQAQASQTFSPLPPGPATLSGVVGYQGSPDCTGNPVTGTPPLAGATVTLLGPDGTVLGTATTDSGGNYSVNGLFEPGLHVHVSGSNLSPSVPGQFDLASGLGLTGNTTQNLTLPSPTTVGVTVTDTTGHPVPGATVGEAAADPTAPFALFSGGTAEPGTQSATPQTTGASGHATLCLFPSPAAHLTAASGARQGSATVDTGNGTATIEIPTLPSVSVTSSLPTAQYKQPVTITATVGPNGSGGPVPTGTVTFSVDGTPQPPVAVPPSGQASQTMSNLTSGVHTITAAYSGDSVYAATTSGPLSQTILPDATVTALSSTAEPSVRGEAGTITATVASGPGQGTPTGKVTFTVDGTQSPAVTLANGKASMQMAALAVGTHSITAAYSGDTNHTASTSAALTQVVNQAAASASLTTTATPSVYGQSGSVTATVSAVPPGTGTPSGTVIFTVDGTPGQPVTLSSGKATRPLAGLGAGTHQITATYSGDQNFLAAASAALTQVISKASTTTKLTSAHNPVQQGGTGSITATVNDIAPATGTPTGTVTFTVDGVARAPHPLSAAGLATLKLSSLSAGTHTITATYNGDANHATSTSAQLIQVVTAAPQIVRTSADSGTEVTLRP
ncbi:MAG TPA: Ig-like domain repeat protein [Streptosporangiaceae bacterium]